MTTQHPSQIDDIFSHLPNVPVYELASYYFIKQQS